MSLTNFDRALEFVLRWEGGYVNHPDDPGGETKYGISKRAYPNENIKDLSRERAGELYRADYWDVFGCDSRPLADALVLFDSAVNCGVARTAVWLDSSKTPKDVLEYRRIHYETLAKKKPLMAKFLKGWLNRLNALHKELEKLSPEKL